MSGTAMILAWHTAGSVGTVPYASESYALWWSFARGTLPVVTAPTHTVSHNDAMHMGPALSSKPRLGYFISNTSLASEGNVTLANGSPPADLGWLGGLRHYRLIPGTWYPKMATYHFDGLATVLRFDFSSEGLVKWIQQPYHSPAYDNFDHCLFFGNGVGPTLGREVQSLHPYTHTSYIPPPSSGLLSQSCGESPFSQRPAVAHNRHFELGARGSLHPCHPAGQNGDTLTRTQCSPRVRSQDRPVLRTAFLQR